MFGDDVLTQLQAAVALPVPEVPQLQDPKTTDALKEQADWLRRLRDDIRQMIDPGIDKQPDDGLMNRLGALEGRVSALSLAPRMSPPVMAVLDPVEETLVVRLQAAIASGAAGNVKRCYWKSATSEWIEYGSAFSAHNAGPKDAPDDGVVLMVPRYTSASLPVFQYGTGADVANTASVIDDRTASAGTAATAMRSDGWPGLKLVGNPADGTAHTVGINREATLQFTVDGGTRYGLQVRIGSIGGVGPTLGLLTVGTGGLFVLVRDGFGIVDTGSGLQFDPADSPTLTGLTLSGLTASKLVMTDGAKALASLNVGTGLAIAAGALGLSHLGLEALTDPNADRIFFWDDSETAAKWLAPGGGIEISGTTLQLATGASGHKLLSNQHGDTTAAAGQTGDLIMCAAAPTWSRFAVGAAYSILQVTAGLPAWTVSPTGLTSVSSAAFISAGTAGYDCTPVADADCDLITVNVTGTPRLWWDESESTILCTAYFGGPYIRAKASGWSGVEVYSDSDFAATYPGFGSYRGSAGYGAVQLGFGLGYLDFGGYDGDSVHSTAGIWTEATENWTHAPAAHGTKLCFYTTATGAASYLTRATIDENGLTMEASHTVSSTTFAADHVTERSPGHCIIVGSNVGDDTRWTHYLGLTGADFARVYSRSIYMQGQAGSAPYQELTYSADSGSCGQLTFWKTRNTLAAPSAVASLDYLGQILFGGYHGAAGWSYGAAIFARAVESWADATHNATGLYFYTRASGAAGYACNVSILSNGTLELTGGGNIYPYPTNNATCGTSSYYWLASYQTTVYADHLALRDGAHALGINVDSDLTHTGAYKAQFRAADNYINSADANRLDLNAYANIDLNINTAQIGTVDSTGLTLADAKNLVLGTTGKVQFRDAATYIASLNANYLDVVVNTALRVNPQVLVDTIDVRTAAALTFNCSLNDLVLAATKKVDCRTNSGKFHPRLLSKNFTTGGNPDATDVADGEFCVIHNEADGAVYFAWREGGSFIWYAECLYNWILS